jgi:hypothetical protein
MSRETRLSRTVRREIERRLKKEREDREPSRVRLLLKAVVFAIGIPSIIGGILSLLPRLSVVPQDSLDLHDPFQAPFVISNDGLVTLYNLQVLCSPRYVQVIAGNGNGDMSLNTHGNEEDETGGMTNSEFVAAKLLPGNKMTFPCHMVHIAEVDRFGRAEIAFVVAYRLFGIPLTRHHVNHFSLIRDTSGHFHWFEGALRQN